MFLRIYEADEMDLFSMDSKKPDRVDWRWLTIGITITSLIAISMLMEFSKRQKPENPLEKQLEIVTYQLAVERELTTELHRSLYESSLPWSVMGDLIGEHAQCHAEVDPQERVGFDGDISGNVFAAPRSSKWRAVRDKYAAEHPCCQYRYCQECNELFVHHKVPFRLDPARELDPTNLVTVCKTHHLYVCHNGNFRDEVPAEQLERFLSQGEWPARGRKLYLLRETKDARRKVEETATTRLD